MDKKLLEKYPHTEWLRVKDTIAVPHPYCITPRHIPNGGGILNESTIEDAERRGAKCCICKGKLPFSEHKQAILVAVRFEGELKDTPGLKEYLLSIKEMALKGGHLFRSD